RAGAAQKTATTRRERFVTTTTRRTRPPAADHGIERVDWSIIGPTFIQSWGWPRGKRECEHLSCYGRTRAGKSTFVLWALNARYHAHGSHCVALATKRTDHMLEDSGWPIVDHWPPGYGHDRCIYWAKAKGISRVYRVPQREKVKDLLNALWVPDSNIILYVDEIPYVTTDLGLKTELDTFYREGAGNGITMVSSQQRPAGTSRYTHSEPGWTVSYKPKDQDDCKRIAEVFGDRQRYMAALMSLDSYKREFLIKSDILDLAYISHLPDLSARVSRDRRPGVHSGHR